jgi:branched-chain amino acid transport system ATP-binding protein
VSATVDAPPSTSLRIEDLHVSRGARQVLEGVTIEITPGEVTALLGPNGAGKSSLVLTVGGALRATSGHVWLDDRDLSHRKPEKIRAAGVAVVPEGRRLLRDLTVEDNLRVATYTLPRDQAASGIDHAVELFPELRKRWDLLAGQLSGGEQQMVVLAQALVSRPKFLLVDELSLGLAPVIVKRLVPTLTEVADSGVGVLLIEQFAHVALGVSKSAYVIEGGRIRYHGTAAELREHPELLQSAYLLRDADEAVVGEIAEAEEQPSN